jgi:general stress protein YciG
MKARRPTDEESSPPAKKPRGIAAMNPQLRRAISVKGGLAAHRAGKAHEFSSEEARKAGRRGAAARHRNRRAGSGPETA